jgi:hypothetical protein
MDSIMWLCPMLSNSTNRVSSARLWRSTQTSSGWRTASFRPARSTRAIWSVYDKNLKTGVDHSANIPPPDKTETICNLSGGNIGQACIPDVHVRTDLLPSFDLSDLFSIIKSTTSRASAHAV